MKQFNEEDFKKLEDWFEANEPKENIIWKESYESQIMFVRNKIYGILLGVKQNKKIDIDVISTHTSKSIKLPVYKISLDIISFTMRNNFYDWKISVNSDFDVNADFLNLFNEKKNHSSCYFEGFKKEWVYGSYSENKKQFSVELYSYDEFLFMFFWIIKEYMNKTFVENCENKK